MDNGDGTYTITPDLTDADGLSQFVDDIPVSYTHLDVYKRQIMNRLNSELRGYAVSYGLCTQWQGDWHNNKSQQELISLRCVPL